ncbi:MAG TPA: glucokinase [Vicinamibacterales bacterium]|jgi:glucokinase
MILAGDIGGTSTRLALFDVGDRVDALAIGVFASASLDRLDDAVDDFLRTAPGQVHAACFGVAGPVVDGRATLPNLPWAVDAQALAQRLRVGYVDVINDLEANAYGISGLAPDDLVALNDAAGRPASNRAILSAGTGLGEAGLYWDGTRHHAIASEGGHADFAPRTELERDLLRELQQGTPHVSYERVLSGEGLHRIFTFLRRRTGQPQPEWVIEAAHRHAAPAAISKAALERTSETAVESLRVFVSCLGAEAGNLALRMMAIGGVYLGGGIAPKILPALQDGTFMTAFVDKGRMKSLLETIPVFVIRNDHTALHGAARVAAMRLDGAEAYASANVG